MCKLDGTGGESDREDGDGCAGVSGRKLADGAKQGVDATGELGLAAPGG
jgi:hypothetical protein